MGGMPDLRQHHRECAGCDPDDRAVGAARQHDRHARAHDDACTDGAAEVFELLREQVARFDIGHDQDVGAAGDRRVDPLVVSRPANARLNEANRLLAAHPHDAGRRRAVAEASRLVEHSVYYRIAREFGRIVGHADRCTRAARLAIVTGGGPGIMEAANRGAYERGAPSIGFNIELPREQAPNPYITPDLCFRFHYFAIRKLHLLERAKAAVFFPGGYGTFDELFEVLTLLQTRKIPPLPVILVGEAYWRRAVDLAFLADEGMIDRCDLDLFTYCESAPDIWRAISGWYARRRTMRRRTTPKPKPKSRAV